MLYTYILSLIVQTITNNAEPTVEINLFIFDVESTVFLWSDLNVF